MYKKLKRILDKFLNNFGIKIIDFFVKHKEIIDFKKNKKSNAYKKDKKYLKEIKKYWRKYNVRIKPIYHFHYSVTNEKQDVRYIPDYLYYTKIMNYFSNRTYAVGINDKNYYNILFKNVIQPETIIRKINGILYDNEYKIIDKKTAIQLCNKNDELIFKPSIENGSGYGITFWSKTNKEVSEVIENYQNMDFIAQKIIDQHPELKKYNPNSLNTIRVTSLILNNKVNILGATLRLGVNGSKVDNACAGGVFVAINNDGTLKNCAFNSKGVKFDKHPNGISFSKKKIPNYNELIKKVKELHEMYGHFRLISWDMTVDSENNIVLIEANLRNGCPFLHQYNNGPIFGELTDEVLTEVFGRKK